MQTSNFQIIVLGICTTLILVGVGVFAAFGGFFGGGSIGRVVIWGTVDSEYIQSFLDTLREQNQALSDVTYIEKPAASYNTELINAMANGTAPDLFMLPVEDLLAFSDKVITIPYGSISQSNYISSFIDEGQIFLTRNGTLALPFIIDPLVMYWNRDLFASAGVATPPQYWNDFLTIAPKITSLELGSNVKRSAVALGEWRNIAHAKEILSTLFMQAGDQIVARDQDGNLRAVLGTTPAGFPSNPAESALRFYTEFVNPSKTSYSWNRALPLSTTAFINGDLAAYFGFASEYQNIVSRNQNLRFSVSVVPQIEGNATKVTFGRLTGLAIPLGAQNPNGALAIAQLLTSKEASANLSRTLMLPSVRRDVPADNESNAHGAAFLQSALISRAWLDPNNEATDSIFQTMIESVVSGKLVSGGAVSDASQELAQLFR